ncbi:hypothetical protein B296_00040146 [Ensete ventricosum]|uniref:Uncharacterized protein n=1 Tax=Ensete ventricosum TaxID=4639 RepID=A0A426ZM20_ENSVE|nr:hypothetical protein B296_00040146 [Ensete ventricosum]
MSLAASRQLYRRSVFKWTCKKQSFESRNLLKRFSGLQMDLQEGLGRGGGVPDMVPPMAKLAQGVEVTSRGVEWSYRGADVVEVTRISRAKMDLGVDVIELTDRISGVNVALELI